MEHFQAKIYISEHEGSGSHPTLSEWCWFCLQALLVFMSMATSTIRCVQSQGDWQLYPLAAAAAPYSLHHGGGGEALAPDYATAAAETGAAGQSAAVAVADAAGAAARRSEVTTATSTGKFFCKEVAILEVVTLLQGSKQHWLGTQMYSSTSHTYHCFLWHAHMRTCYEPRTSVTSYTVNYHALGTAVNNGQAVTLAR